MAIRFESELKETLGYNKPQELHPMNNTIKIVMVIKFMNGGNRMFRSWKFIFLVIVSIALLTACGQSLEDRVTEGIKAAKEAFLCK